MIKKVSVWCFVCVTSFLLTIYGANQYSITKEKEEKILVPFLLLFSGILMLLLSLLYYKYNILRSEFDPYVISTFS